MGCTIWTKRCLAILWITLILGPEALHAKKSKVVVLDGESFPALEALSPPTIPADNPQRVDAAGWPLWDDPKVQLGLTLFFDPRLSGNGKISCSSCHEPEEGWGLRTALSHGAPATVHWRNAPTIVNIAYQEKLFWDGRIDRLEAQAPGAAQASVAGNGNPHIMRERLRQVPFYRKQIVKIFGNDQHLLRDAWRAIAAFERALIQKDTPFDRFERGDKKALSKQQLRGRKLFEGKARCIVCHNGPLASDQKFHNIGVRRRSDIIVSAQEQAMFRAQLLMNKVSPEVFSKTKFDHGVNFSTGRSEDIARFRTAPLRFVKHTAPYMHHGGLANLEEVIQFYDEGGYHDLAEMYFDFPTKSKLLKRLKLTKQEKEELKAFVESFSGDQIIVPKPTLPKSAALE